MPGTIAVILKGYPRLSETFIAQELLGLERAGLKLRLFSMRHPTTSKRHPVHDEITAPVSYLPEYLHDEPMRVLRGWWKARRLPGYKATRAAWLADLKREPTRNQVRRFGQALVLAAELPGDVTHLHAHFIHTPGTVTRYASLLTGLPWTCSAHAKDIWTSTDADLKGKLAETRWVVTCTETGWRHLRELSPRPDSVHLSYHGLDLSRFAAPQGERPARDGNDPAHPVELVTVCRAVEKKGLDILIAALALLPDDLHWHWTHIGGGDLEETLKRQGAALGDRLSWLGSMTQAEVLARYRDSDLFVLPCRIARDGDRDGLPNVIVEAQSQRLAVVSTTVSGVPELIRDGVNGLLVPPEDPDALAAALARLIRDPQARQEMGAAGEARVRGEFDMAASIAQLEALFGQVRDAEKALAA